MTRRELIRAVFLFVVGVVALVLALVLLWRARRLWQVAVRFAPRLDPSSSTGTLSEAEIQALVAFAEVLVEARRLSSDQRRHLIEHIDDRTRNTLGYLSLYRMTASLLDRLAGTRFATLDLRDRTDVMTRHRLTSYPVRAREYLLPFRRQELTVRALAVPDLIAGYYHSPAGWAVVGYEASPGRCSNLVRYTRPEPSGA